MKKVLIATLFILFAIVIFTGLVYFLTRDSGKGALQVTSQPKSRVYLNGKFLGETPLCKCDQKDMIDAGEYKVRVVPEDTQFDPFENQIKITPKVLTVIDRTFQPDGAASGSIISLTKLEDENATELEVISLPSEASLFVDNNATGFTPIKLPSVSESDHEIKLTREGYQDKTIRIRTIKGFRLEALVFLGISTASQGEEEESGETVEVTKITILQTPTGFLRVRESASTGSPEIGRVSPGEEYDLLEEDNGWFKIRISETEEGWVSGQYARKN